MNRPKQSTQSYASLLHNSRHFFLNTRVASPRVKRKMWMADNKCSGSIVHSKTDSNKSVFCLKKGERQRRDDRQTDGHQMATLQGRRVQTIKHKHANSNLFATGIYINQGIGYETLSHTQRFQGLGFRVDVMSHFAAGIGSEKLKYQMSKFIDFCEVWFLPESVARVANIDADHHCQTPRH
ncbi:hypothetical protein TNCV_3071021 [Trichonephila clavipes]|nr:hypothetical protein TNCV_3071021 [Trichonephila clavipes]